MFMLIHPSRLPHETRFCTLTTIDSHRATFLNIVTIVVLVRERSPKEMHNIRLSELGVLKSQPRRSVVMLKFIS